jgi:hypothetical protein
MGMMSVTREDGHHPISDGDLDQPFNVQTIQGLCWQESGLRTFRQRVVADNDSDAFVSCVGG